MFRCITTLKGLIIDIDSFANEHLENWFPFVRKYTCIFLTSQNDQKVNIQTLFGEQAVYQIQSYQRLFAPNAAIHHQCIKILGLQPTEIAYVSSNIDFIRNAMGYLCGTIWITRHVNYDEASHIADLVSSSLSNLYETLSENIQGFLGEITLFPDIPSSGTLIPITFTVDGASYPIIVLGRYFGYTHYMSQLHPYSTAIYLNKQKGRPYYGVYDNIFARLYSIAVKQLLKSQQIFGICSVPARPGIENRFSAILDSISNDTGIHNSDGLLTCTRFYPSQKSLSYQERIKNIHGLFRTTHQLDGETIVLIDDIASTGATLRECIRELRKSGAGNIISIVLAINQIHEAYWSSSPVEVHCPHCNQKMRLLVNSGSRQFFYRCTCNNTLSFNDGRHQIITQVNQELVHLNEQKT